MTYPWRTLAVASLALALSGPARAAAGQATTTTYVTPMFRGYMSGSDADFASAVAELRSRIGDGASARAGFAIYLGVSMNDWTVDTSSPAAVRAALGAFEQQLDAAIGRARAQNIALTICLLTAIRDQVDPVQQASYAEDRRVMQWYPDNLVAGGWWTHSRYARKQYGIQRAYMREVAKILANRIALYPETLVAIAGDGEVELSYDRINDAGGPTLADFSPFAIAEFRDWLRGKGLYDTGQPFASEAYALSARYHDDPAPGTDSPAPDGHTLNGDFGTSFLSWSLRYFDWSLSDIPNSDVNLIPSAVYTAPGFNPLPTGCDTCFDAPRVTEQTNAWWQLWNQFRARLIWHHNKDLASWMTTTADDTGHTIPPDRWFSYQVPADYLFGHTPAAPDVRLITSASPWWTANVQPFGGLGFTAFGANQGGGAYARTLPALLDAMRPCAAGQSPPTCIDAAAGIRDVPWGIFEWNPSVPPITDPAVYMEEIELLRRYRPRVLVPFEWDVTDYAILETGFEPALRQFVNYIKDGWTPSLQIARTALTFTATRANGANGALTPAQSIAVTEPTGGLVDWSATAGQSWLALAGASGHGNGSFAVDLNAAAVSALPLGTHQATITISAPGSIEGQRTVTVTLTVADTTTSHEAFGSFDTPAPNSTGLSGAIPVTGWALDDVGVDRVQIWRNCVETIDRPAGACAASVPGGPADSVFIGDAAFLAGARPDVEAANPGNPMAYRAGWGYLMATNALPHLPTGRAVGGQGTFALSAYAIDREGHYTLLGQKTISLDNDHANIPFGAIDTPNQGGTIPGATVPFDNANAYPNFGWAMTQAGKCIDVTSVSSYKVYIDGVPRTLTPGTNWFPGLSRGDIAAAYPGLCNSNNALAAYYINASALGLTDGLHTIGWDIIDDTGAIAGIGSRFFWLAQPVPAGGADLRSAGDVRSAGLSGPRSGGPERAALRMPGASHARHLSAHAGAGTPPFDPLQADASGRFTMRVDPGARLAIDLDGAVETGFQEINGQFRALPGGSSLDVAAGRFYWQPPVGFRGTFSIVFVTPAQERVDVNVTIAGAPGETMTGSGHPARVYVRSRRDRRP